MKRLVFIVFAGIMFAACSDKKQQAAGAGQQAPQARPMPVVKVEKRNVTKFVEYPAEITGMNDSDIRPNSAGFITKVLIKEGQEVRKGQELFKIETKVLTENAAAAKAAIATAQVQADRLRPLVAKNIVSEVQLKTAEAQLAQAKANYKSIEANINYAKVISPVSGVVGRINYREGALVSASSPLPLTTVSNTKTVYAYITVNEKQYLSFYATTPGNTINQKLKSYPPLDLILANGKLYEYKGKMAATTGQLDATTGTIQFRVDFKNPQGLLSAGSNGTIRVPHVYNNVIAIPEVSISEMQGKISVYKVVDNKLVSAVIDIAERTKNMVIVSRGLKVGDEILGTGIVNARSGMPIVPQPISMDSLTNIKRVF